MKLSIKKTKDTITVSDDTKKVSYLGYTVENAVHHFRTGKQLNTKEL